ncbi:MAG: FG-GAP repeat protein [Planctomycetota bacterium]
MITLGGTNAGSVYVFRYDGTSWVQEQAHRGGCGAFDAFGRSVSVSSDVIVVGAVAKDHDGATNAGAAYVFRYDGASWVQQQELIAPDAAASDAFGISASASGEVAVIGAYTDNHAGGTGRAGAAYVFRYDGTSWVQEQKLTAADAAAYDYFGTSVSVSGNVAVVGADDGEDAQGRRTGSAYVFRHDGTSWVQEQKLTASDGAAFDLFGESVSVDGKIVVVGSPLGDHGGGTDAGSAYVFRYDGTSWVQEQKLTASDAAADDKFGDAVSVSGNVAVVGAFFVDHAGSEDAGATYVFDMPDATWLSYGSGWPGTNGVPSFTAAGDPVLCTTVTLNLDNSLGTNTTAALFIGLAQSDQPTIYGGHLLLVPTTIFLLPLPGGGLALPGSLPCDPILCGVSVFLQALEVDAGAAKGISFTPGLQLVLGS